jgi:hypothetical protein
LLAGTKGDVGGEKELLLLKSSVQRFSNGPLSVKTTMITAGNHEYVGEEAQVAQTIAQWIETESPHSIVTSARGVGAEESSVIIADRPPDGKRLW